MMFSCWETKAFSKDLDILSSDKNCKKIDFRKKIFDYFEDAFKRLEQRHIVMTIDDFIILKSRLKHPCLQEGKSGGLRIFWGIYKKTSQQEQHKNMYKIIFIRLIYKAKEENLSAEEIEEALHTELTETIRRLDPTLIPGWLLKLGCADNIQ